MGGAAVCDCAPPFFVSSEVVTFIHHSLALLSCRRASLVLGALFVVALAPGGAAPADAQAPWDAAQARTFVAEGRFAEALAAADERLAVAGRDREAVAVRVIALLRLGRGTEAVDTYEAFRKPLGADAHDIEAAMADAVLRRLAEKATTSELRSDAVEVLARHGDAEARKALEALAGDTTASAASWNATAALARLGDRRARARIADGMASKRVGMQLTTLNALRRVGIEGSLEAVRQGLRSPEPPVQAAAAELAAQYPSKALTPDLRAVVEKGRFGAPLWAALALWKLGDRAGEKLLAEAMAAPYEDGRLIAARAFPRDDPATIHVLTRLLESENALFRIQAAALLTPQSPAAKKALYAALESDNQLVRGEAMRVLAADRQADPALLRWGFRDWAPTVQLEAARAVLARQLDDAPGRPRQDRR